MKTSRRSLLASLLILGLLAAAPGRGVGSESPRPWVLVDTRQRALTVMLGDRPLEHFEHVALGAAGPGEKRWRGDDKTPVGSFRVGWIKASQRFDLFIGLDYPNQQYAERALLEGRIDEDTYLSIVAALERGRTPPQNTELGGYIGIHGLGAGDPRIHQNFDWTGGCVALTNDEIRRLARWVSPGTRVEIR